MSDEREAKLPVSPTSRLRRLQTTLAKNMLAIAREQARVDGCTGKVIADGIANQGFPLHDRATVKFVLPNGHAYVRLRDNGTVLDINCSGTVLVRPQASNSIYVTLEER